MCKVHDHVSFPSPVGVRMAARASGLRVERVWSTELPFEFPVSALVAVRDRARERRRARQADSDCWVQAPAGPAGASPAGSVNPAARSALTRFYSVAGPFDPTSRLLGMLGRAGSVKARLTR